MQISFKPTRPNKSAYALLMVMCFLAATLLVFASVMYWISNNAKITARNNQFNMSEAAAEAAAEKALSLMNYAYVAQSFTNDGTYFGSSQNLPNTNDMAGWPIKYVFSDTNGIQNQISVDTSQPWTTYTVPLTSQYTNLYGLVKTVNITATATPVPDANGSVAAVVPATVCESIQFASIPLFQFAVFYNMDLEIDPGSAMNIKGAVWSNAGIWSGTPNVTYSSTVCSVGTNYYAPNAQTNPFCMPLGSKTDSTTGTPIANFTIAPIQNNDRITMPIGTNNDPATVAGIVNIPPSTYPMNSDAAFTTNGQVYFANAADLYLTNFSNGTNWGAYCPGSTYTTASGLPSGMYWGFTNMILYYQDAANGSGNYWSQLPYNFFIMTNRFVKSIWITNAVSLTPSTNVTCYSNILYSGYSFVTNSLFYDWREGWNNASGPPKAVQAVEIDLNLYNIWLTNSTTLSNGASTYNNQCMLNTHKAHPIDSIYVFNGVPLTATTLPAVRVKNGIMLPTQTAPYGFTVATAQPMYVWGDYNAKNTTGSSLSQNGTAHAWPAALIADAITILSDNWADSNCTFAKKATCTAGGPTPTTTTVNAAMVEGIVRSTNSLYSGGLENFLRLLENWNSGIPLWYNGSIVVMFPSQFATNYWNGSYYGVPKRNWAFDTNFTAQAGLPPLTPQAKGVIRSQWQGY